MAKKTTTVTKTAAKRFKLTELVGNSVLITGTDINGVTGQMVVCAREYKDLLKSKAERAALEAHDEAIEKFWKPLTDAAEALEAAQAAEDEVDPLTVYVEEEGQAAVPEVERVEHKLARCTVTLRAIEEGHEDRLIWVNDVLVLTK